MKWTFNGKCNLILIVMNRQMKLFFLENQTTALVPLLLSTTMKLKNVWALFQIENQTLINQQGYKKTLSECHMESLTHQLYENNLLVLILTMVKFYMINQKMKFEAKTLERTRFAFTKYTNFSLQNFFLRRLSVNIPWKALLTVFIQTILNGFIPKYLYLYRTFPQREFPIEITIICETKFHPIESKVLSKIFFPYCVNEWSNLKAEGKIAKSIHLFKNMIVVKKEKHGNYLFMSMISLV